MVSSLIPSKHNYFISSVGWTQLRAGLVTKDKVSVLQELTLCSVFCIHNIMQRNKNDIGFRVICSVYEDQPFLVADWYINSTTLGVSQT